MKLLTVSAALLAAVALAPASAEAQVSRKDYERRERTTAQADPPESSRTAPRKRVPVREATSAPTPPRRRTNRGVSRKDDWRGRERTRSPAPRTTNPAPRTTPQRRGNPGLNVDLFLGALGADYLGQRLTRRERARFQRDLADRARDLRDWAVDLERRDAFLDRRRPQVRRIANRYRLPPNRRLGTRELYDWDAELRARAERLDYRERRVDRRERRRGRRWDGPERGYDDRAGYCPPGW